MVFQSDPNTIKISNKYELIIFSRKIYTAMKNGAGEKRRGCFQGSHVHTCHRRDSASPVPRPFVPPAEFNHHQSPQSAGLDGSAQNAPGTATMTLLESQPQTDWGGRETQDSLALCDALREELGLAAVRIRPLRPLVRATGCVPPGACRLWCWMPVIALGH